MELNKAGLKPANAERTSSLQSLIEHGIFGGRARKFSGAGRRDIQGCEVHWPDIEVWSTMFSSST